MGYIKDKIFYLCIKTVIMNSNMMDNPHVSHRQAFTRGKVYKSTGVGVFRDDNNEEHWVTDDTWASEHFIPISDILDAYGQCMADFVKNKRS